jgi:hypothetical protein
MKYPRKLSSGANNTVIVLSDTEVAKLFMDEFCYVEMERQEMILFKTYFLNR